MFSAIKIIETLAQQRGEARDAKMAFQLIYRQPRNQPNPDSPKSNWATPPCPSVPKAEFFVEKDDRTVVSYQRH